MKISHLDLLSLSRRDFLRFACLGCLSLLAPSPTPGVKNGATAYGRMVRDNVSVYSQPSPKSKLVKVLYKDDVQPITGTTFSDAPPSYNRIWFELNGEGYAHSGDIQPVQINNNPLVDPIASGGQLAEVTVPYTDTYFWPNGIKSFAYRLVYSTTHWVRRVVRDDRGEPWYEIYDDKIKGIYYVNPIHLRIITAEDISPLSPDIPASDKKIEVRLIEQVLTAYEGGQVVFVSRVATGGIFSTGDFSTPLGYHYTRTKRPTRHMAAGDRAAANSFDLPGIPWVSYFTKDGLALHGTYWHNDFGKPRSHGCINLSSQAALWVYRWTLPGVPLGEDIAYDNDATLVEVIS